MDHGTEFAFVRITCHIFGMSITANLCFRAYHSITIKRNVCAELYQQINYPVKRLLVEMENREDVTMADEVCKFCVSWVTINVMASAV